MSKCFFTEMEFETKNIEGNVIKETKLMFHDERSGFVGLASDAHKQAHPSEFQEFLALSDKKASPEEMKPVTGTEEESAFEDKNATVPVDKKAEEDLSELAVEEQTE